LDLKVPLVLFRHLGPLLRLFQEDLGDLLSLTVQVIQEVLDFLTLPWCLGSLEVQVDLAYLDFLWVQQVQLELAYTRMDQVKVLFHPLETAGFVPRRVGYPAEVREVRGFLAYQAYQDYQAYPFHLFYPIHLHVLLVLNCHLTRKSPPEFRPVVDHNFLAN